jgi:4-hydroxy-3-polyprenylbenzoate decarboxylase
MADESGFTVGVELLRALRDAGIETHLVPAANVGPALYKETGMQLEDVCALADRAYSPSNQAARISSGSFLTLGMVIAPCGPRSLASVSRGYADDLVHRAADVTMKEHRPLVMAIRREALRLIDLDNVETIRAVPGGDVVLVDDQETSSQAGVRGIVAQLLAPFVLWAPFLL